VSPVQGEVIRRRYIKPEYLSYVYVRWDVSQPPGGLAD